MIDHFTQKRVLIGAAATTVFVFLFDFIVHGKLLMDMWLPYEKLFRPMAEMEAMGAWCFGYHIGMSLLFAGGFYLWRDKIKVGKVGTSECPYRKGMKFGLWVGALLALPQLMTYMWLPFDTLNLPAIWAVSELVKWSLAGALLSKLYKKMA